MDEIFPEDGVTSLVEEGKLDFFKDGIGDTIGLIASVYLKDSHGRIVTDYPKELPLKSTLVYEDGSPTPSMTSNGRKDLFRCMKEATLGGTWRDSCIFRIEEVSSKHKRICSGGFKLKLSPMSGSCSDVADAVMEQTIYVKSKVPKKKQRSIGKKNRGGRRSVLDEEKRRFCRKNIKDRQNVIESKGEWDISNRAKRRRAPILSQDTHAKKVRSDPDGDGGISSYQAKRRRAPIPIQAGKQTNYDFGVFPIQASMHDNPIHAHEAGVELEGIWDNPSNNANRSQDTQVKQEGTGIEGDWNFLKQTPIHGTYIISQDTHTNRVGIELEEDLGIASDNASISDDPILSKDILAHQVGNEQVEGDFDISSNSDLRRTSIPSKDVHANQMERKLEGDWGICSNQASMHNYSLSHAQGGLHLEGYCDIANQATMDDGSISSQDSFIHQLKNAILEGGWDFLTEIEELIDDDPIYGKISSEDGKKSDGDLEFSNQAITHDSNISQDTHIHPLEVELEGEWDFLNQTNKLNVILSNQGTRQENELEGTSDFSNIVEMNHHHLFSQDESNFGIESDGESEISNQVIVVS